jgi:hypothetical protein
VTREVPDPPETGHLVRPFVGADFDARAGQGGLADADAPAEPVLRPFLLTSGRVRSSSAIALETQVISTDYGYDARARLAFECRDIVALCTVPQSVAEIAARLSLHLGVVRVLVGDLADEGYLYAYLPNADAAQDIDTLLRVIHGLRAIS